MIFPREKQVSSTDPIVLDYGNCCQLIDSLILEKGINDIIKENFTVDGQQRKLTFSNLENAIKDLKEVIAAGIKVMHGISVIGYTQENGETLPVHNDIPETLEGFKSTLLQSLSVDWTEKKRNNYSFEQDPVVFQDMVNYIANAMVSAYSQEGTWEKFQNI